MGLDDRNEGDADGECLEHVWKLAGVTLALDGAHEDYVCLRCDSVTMRKTAT